MTNTAGLPGVLALFKAADIYGKGVLDKANLYYCMTVLQDVSMHLMMEGQTASTPNPGVVVNNSKINGTTKHFHLIHSPSRRRA